MARGKKRASSDEEEEKQGRSVETKRPRTRSRTGPSDSPVTPPVFVGPSPTPAAPLLLAHRPVYPAADRHFQDFDCTLTPYKWVRVHARKPKSKMKMTVMAMIAELHQFSSGLHPRMRIACPLLCLRIAEWMLTHPQHSVPSTRNLNNIFLQLDRDVKNQGPKFLPRQMLNIDEALQRVPGLHCDTEIQASLASETLSHPDTKNLYYGAFDEMWDTHIATRRNAVFVVNRSSHFVVMRIDTDGKFWVVNTIGDWLDSDLERAFVLSFGSQTIFSDDEQPNQLVHGLSSSDACRKYFRDYLGGDLGDYLGGDLGGDLEGDYYDSQFAFFRIRLTHNEIPSPTTTITGGEAVVSPKDSKELDNEGNQ